MHTKEWPANTYQIFAPRKDDPGRIPIPKSTGMDCSDCGEEIVVAQRSFIIAAVTYPQLEVRCVCIECGVEYKHPDILIDDRPAS